MFTDDAAFQATRRYYAQLLIVIAIGVLARLFYFDLSIGSDDQLWIASAREFGTPPSTHLHGIYQGRILFRLVLYLWGLLVGLSLETSAVVMFALSCITTWMVAETGRAAFGRRAGVLAAAVYTTHPLVISMDVIALPDNLAVALLAAYVFLFLRYLQTQRVAYLASSAFLVGVSFAAKEYFVLAALPFGLCLLRERTSWNTRWRRGGLFAGFLVLGISVDLLLNLWGSEKLLTHFLARANYGEMSRRRWPLTEPFSLQLAARVTAQRLRYGGWLFFDYGFVCGFMLLWGTIFLAVGSRARLHCWMLLSTAAVFLLFLAAMPGSLKPLIFVEMQARYLMVLVPLLAAGAGGALSATLDGLKEKGLSGAALTLLLIAFGYNLVVPNGMRDQYRTLEFAGIKQVLQDAHQQQIQEMVFPEVGSWWWSHRVFMPDSYYSYGVKLSFPEVKDAASTEAVREYAASEPGRAVFVPRTPYSSLDGYLRSGRYDPQLEVLEPYQPLAWLLDERGFRRVPVRVPTTHVRAWLQRIGLKLFQAEGELVGWVYRMERR